MQEREFEELLWKARNKDKKAVFEIIEMYRPLLLKYAKSNGKFDEDLYQELVCCSFKKYYKISYETEEHNNLYIKY
mgnify:CR=1 FL=1